MKKLIYSAAALAMAFFAASCQQENLEPVAQESTVTFSVELPGVQTKAIGDGFNVDQLVYEVWKTEAANERDLKDVTKATRLYQETATMAKLDGEQKTVISLNLVHDQNYTILFWAQNSKAINETEPAYVTDDLTAVTYKKAVRTAEYLSNNENMAAFYNVAFLTKTEIEQPSTRRVELKRPFAQLNIGTKNTVEEYTVTMNKSKVKIANVPTTFDVAQNIAENREKGIEAHPAVTDTAAFVFEYAFLPDETLVVNDTDYDYVAMNYIFADGNVDVQYWIDATLTATDPTADRNTETKATVYNFVPEVPLKENYRTNIVGNLLSSNTKYEVVIDASWDDVKDPELNDDGYVVEVWDKHYIQQPPKVDGVYEISLASELAWVAASVNGTIPKTKTLEYEAPVTFVGETFKLVEDIDLTGALWSPIGNNKAQKYVDTFRGTFDGNGHVIKNMTVKNPEVAGLFGYMTHGTVKNVTIDGFDLEANHYAGAIVGWVEGKITVEGCTVKNGQIDLSVVEKDLGDKAGGIVGFAHNGTYTGNTVDNVVINGYRDLGGIAGCLQSNGQVINSTVKNSVITADLTAEYDGVKAANAGMVVGRLNSENANIEVENTENVKVYVIVDEVDEMNVALGRDKTFIYLNDGEYNFDKDVNVAGTLQVTTGNTVVLNGNNHNVNVGTASDYGFQAKGAGASLIINEANITSAGGAIGVFNGGSITIKSGSVKVDSPSTSGRYVIYASGEGSVVTVEGGEFSWDPNDNNRRAYIYTESGGTVYVKGGTFGKPSTRSDYKAGIRGDGNVIITGGTFGFDPTAWVAPGYHVKKDGANWVVVSLSEGDNLKDAVAVAGATVNMAAGEYVFPSSSIAEGVTINCEEGTVFTGNSKLNIKGATVIGATFSNPSGTAVDQTINGTFKDCVFEGANALRWCTAGETVVFENCVFSGSTYGVHFDGGANDVLFKNCTFSGFNAFGAAITLVTFEGCTFQPNGKSGYNGANLWGSTKMIGTKFVFDGSVANEWIDCIGTDKTYEFTGCTINNGTAVQPDYIWSRNVGTKITFDGVTYTWAEGGYLVDENGAAVVTNAKALSAAIAAGQAKVSLMTGTYDGLFDLSGKTMTIEAAQGASPNIEGMVWADNCEVTLKGLTLTNPNGVQHPNPTNSKYYATINNQYPLVGAYNNANIKFVECTMNLTGPTIYGFYGYAHNTPVFERCTFNCNKIRPIANNGKSITVTGCTFVDQYHYSVRIFENNGEKQTVVYTDNTVEGTNDKGEFEGINISLKGGTATVLADFTIKGNTDVEYRHHKNVTMSADCTYDTDITGFAFEKEN